MIESLLFEKRIFPPSTDFVKTAAISGTPAYKKMYDESLKNPQKFWGELAKKHLSWQKPFTQVLDESEAPFFKWFADGKFNVSYNCLDRHLKTQPDKLAIIFEADDGKVTKITYRELHARVCEFADALKKLSVKKGDRVIIYLPMSIEAAVAMQACARIGAIHSVVFAGFSAKSLHERILDTGASLVICADGQFRGGKQIPLKSVVDEALALGGCEKVKNVIVYKRTGEKINFDAKRDKWWGDLEGTAREPEIIEAEHPLFILYTSGSTGKPKGIQHSSAGYLLFALMTMKWVFDIKPSDIFWCTADVGWITGHSYIVYGPLAAGATVVMFESVPTYPDAGRFWKVIADHKVSVFYTAPTAIRSLIKLGPDLPAKYDLSSLRLLGSVGEPINPEAWMWYYEKVGNKRCPIVDTWWQTETGGHLIAPLPGVHALKPGSCAMPLPGIDAAIVDENGKQEKNGDGGALVIKKPWPGMIRTIWNDPKRFKESYYPARLGGNYYLAGDGARIDEDGYFWIAGRIDDVLNVSGHRLGTMEIESALAMHPLVAEAAVVGKKHEIKGEAVVAFVVLKKDSASKTKDELTKILCAHVAKEIGSIAKPDEIRFGKNLPKTRSGKIMRRLLRSLANNEEITADISTLENPGILEELKN